MLLIERKDCFSDQEFTFVAKTLTSCLALFYQQCGVSFYEEILL